MAGQASEHVATRHPSPQRRKLIATLFSLRLSVADFVSTDEAAVLTLNQKQKNKPNV
jgi:hypothetical protein